MGRARVLTKRVLRRRTGAESECMVDERCDSVDEAENKTSNLGWVIQASGKETRTMDSEGI